METQKLLSKKIGYGVFGFIGFLCAFLWKAERDLAVQTNILWTGSYILEIVAFSLIGVLAGVLICFLVYGIAEGKWKILTKVQAREEAEAQKPGKFGDVCQDLESRFGKLTGRKVFLLSLLLIILCWMPCYLAYYPAICSYDTTIQLGQIVEDAFNDHHPIAHTLLLQGAMNLGDAVFGSVNTGIGILAAVQMIFLACMFAYAITQLHYFRVNTGWIICLLLYCMIYPFHWYMSVSTIKDTWFSAFFLLQIVSLCALLLQDEKKSRWNRHTLLFLIGTVGMIVFRNNGRYAMLVLIVFMLVAILKGKERRKLFAKIFAYTITGFLLGSIVTSALFQLTDAQQGDKREMLSMPIQQLARTMVYHGGIGVVAEDDNTLSPEDKALINDFLLNESYKEYRPDISDPVKRHTNTYVVRYRAKEFISMYLRLFVQYPGDYINAALTTNAGFLSPGDISHATINVNGRDAGLGYIQTRWVENELNPQGIYKASKWEGLHEGLEKWADENAYLDIPVLKYLFVPGAYLWFYLLLTGVLLVYRKYHMLIPLALVLGYYGTLLLGPTVQLRYIYPVMIVLPFVTLFSLTKKELSE